MKFDIHVHLRADPETLLYLDQINHKVGQIMTKLSELEGRLKAVNDTLGKIGNETTATLDLVTKLRGELEDVELPPGAEAALNDLETQAKKVDDMVPDPVQPPEGGETSSG